MVTEYIKRGYRKAYDSEGNLLYLVPESEPSPLATYNTEEVLVEDEDMPPLNLV
jgi:hypothetical protein